VVRNEPKISLRAMVEAEIQADLSRLRAENERLTGLTEALRISEATLNHAVASQKARIAELSETWTDENGTVWEPPTAWAYAMACKTMHAQRARAEAAEKRIAELEGERDAATLGLSALRAALPKLREVAHAVWHALDDGEDLGDGGHRIGDATDLNAALAALCGEEDDIHYALEPIDAIIAALSQDLTADKEGEDNG
jgi:hypothetical protein